MATVAYSGGIDSTVLMYELASQGRLNLAVLCNFGQPSFDRQLRCAEYQIAKLEEHGVDVHFRVVEFKTPEEFQVKEASPFFSMRPLNPLAKAPKKMKDAIAYRLDNFAITPGRNAFMVLMVGMVAAALETNPAVVTAYQYEQDIWDTQDTISGDESPSFWLKMGMVLETAFEVPVALENPFLDRHWDKERIIREGIEYGIDFAHTMSCEFEEPCGECAQCQLVKKTVAKTRG